MLKPTVDCSSLRAEDEGKDVVLAGWVSSWRDHGGVIFMDLRDIGGITQVVFGREKSSLGTEKERELIEKANSIRKEYVISIKGKVQRRPEGTENKKLPTGAVEVIVEEVEILNECRELPFDFKNMEAVGENTRLKYRYLEMRSGRLRENLIFKHRFFNETRNFFSGKNFLEIETPFLTKSTPEGARDFLVPSRMNPGKFYALPQSPQLFKQILMVGGMMRYFQIVKCFRDEDLRQDRQPEFTQLDMEMSFADEKDIKNLLEEYLAKVFKKLMDVDLERPFKSISYEQALYKYGSDKPDLRNPIEIKDITDIARESSFMVFKNASQKGMVRGFKVGNGEKISLSDIDRLTNEIKDLGAKGLAWMRFRDKKLNSQITKFFTEKQLERISSRFSASEGDILFFVADKESVVLKALSCLRDKFYSPDDKRYEFVWVEDYPLFEKDEETGALKSMHHPFTAPKEDNFNLIKNNPLKIKSRAYDLVLNGSEIGGGSIRIHSLKEQKEILRLLGVSSSEADEKFGFLLKALSYGAPPHGGFAFGIDRLVEKMMGLESIRDVIPFPKTQKAYSPLTDAPSYVNTKQLKELGIGLDSEETLT